MTCIVHYSQQLPCSSMTQLKEHTLTKTHTIGLSAALSQCPDPESSK